MNIPKSQNIHSQNFNSKFVEFVWRFELTEGERAKELNRVFRDQFILQIYKDGTTYLEVTLVEILTDRDREPWILESDQPIIGGKWKYQGKVVDYFWPDVYKNFNYGNDLLPLIEEVKEFLNPHVCDYEDTGAVQYISPLRYEQKCSCGKRRWKTTKSMSDHTVIYEYD